MGDYVPLSLAAEDYDDLVVVAACVQDSLVPLAGVEYDTEARNFRLVANRFCWECTSASEENPNCYQRVLAGLTFHNVKNVLRKGLELAHPNELMNLLTLRFSPEEKSLDLVFSGGAQIKLEVDSFKCYLQDLDAPYPTSNKPDHD